MLTFLLLFLADPLLTPQWKVGQEYLYRGAVKENGTAGSIQLLNQFQLELRIIVLSSSATSAEVVCCTRLNQHGVTKSDRAVSVHLTRALIDPLGNILSTSAPTGMPLVVDGPATFETGFLLPLPTESLQPGKSWEMAEPGRLPRRFTWLPAEPNATHQTIEGEQRSIDWDRPRADSTAWRRLDKLTFTQSATLPLKIRRTLERRAPAHQQVTSLIMTEYELIRQEVLTGPMFEERQRDIQLILKLQDDIKTLASLPHDSSTREAWNKLAVRIARLQSSAGSTPYRETLATLFSTVQAGLDNRLPLQQASAVVPQQAFQIGQTVPPFTLHTTTGSTISSQQCKGMLTLIVFLQPGSNLTKTLSIELPDWQRRLGDGAFHCLLLAANDDVSALPALPGGEKTRTTGTQPILLNGSGKSLASTFGVTATPHFIMLDKNHTLLASTLGWGPETRLQLDKLIKQQTTRTK